LTDEDVYLKRIPDISDVWIMADILRSLGAKVKFEGKGEMYINCSNLTNFYPPYEFVGKMNASFDVTGPLLARLGEAKVSLPGGCNLGSRPVDMHMDAFRILGAEVEFVHGFVHAKANKLIGKKIQFRRVSVGATKNAMMAAVLADGITVLESAAMEPEIIDLAVFLNTMGARITGIGSSTIVIEGVKKLHGLSYEIIPDRILTGTYLVAGAITRGTITVKRTWPDFLESFINAMRNAGQNIVCGKDYITVEKSDKILPTEIISAPHPGFPTDLQPVITALLSIADGTSIVTENIFDRRFMYVDELRRLGANMSVSDRTCIIRGVKKLFGAPVKAHDIRAGGSLICACLSAEGESIITGLEFIDRGHEKIESVLTELGADIRRID
ncbi:UDP-N-acetylglucosamine 1-carboxyvinyltransferase, partial [bacterium]|nr:UDP-N-acetylglucosamine 1-carboxyvinyltransferase [bacterium]